MVTTPTQWSLFPVHVDLAGGVDDDQTYPSIVGLTDGNMVAVWTDNTQTSDTADVLRIQVYDHFGRKIDVAGQTTTPAGHSFVVDPSVTGKDEGNATLTALPGGGFVVAFERDFNSNQQGATPDLDVYTVYYQPVVGANGEYMLTPLSNPIASSGSDEKNPTLAGFSDNSYLVAYEVNAPTASRIDFRIIDNQNNVSNVSTLSVSANYDQTNPDAARLTSDQVVVVYERQLNTSTEKDIAFRVIDKTGAISASTFGVTSGGHNDTYPVVAGLTNGTFAIAWTDEGGLGADTSGAAIGVAIYSYSNGNASIVSATQLVNTTTTGAQIDPDITSLKDGGFVVSWQDGLGGPLQAQRFAADGSKVGSEFALLPNLPGAYPFAASITETADGRIAAVAEVSVSNNSDVVGTIFDPREEFIYGTTGNDKIASRVLGATIFGLDGNDILSGLTSIDKLIGGKGDDELYGDLGDDVLGGEDGDDLLLGGADNDRISGGNGFDVIHGGSGNDIAAGGSGFDRIFGEDGNDRLFGGAFGDYIRGGNDRDLVKGDSGSDRLFGDNGIDRIYGGAHNDYIRGGNDKDILFGEHGNDRIFGDAGTDFLIGGTGRDLLVGGADRDRFLYYNINESRGALRDKIVAFEQGLDDIDLRKIDANTTVGGNQRFKFIGDNNFTHTAGELHYRHIGSYVRLEADVNGDAHVDFHIDITGTTFLTAGDIFL